MAEPLGAAAGHHRPGTAVRDCEAAGVITAPGNEWFPAEPTGSLRLNYSGPNTGPSATGHA